jgi:hypothetical protein
MQGNANSKDDPRLQAQNLELRVAISSAYAAVEAQKAIQSFSAITFEELADAQIQRLTGADTPERLNELNRVQRVLTNIKQSVAKIKALPPEAFAKPDSKRDVNTPANG